VRLLSPTDSQFKANYQIRVALMTESKEGRFKAHVVAGVELLQQVLREKVRPR
jgi:hypothetical protein